MAVTTFQGIVEDGQIRLGTDVRLPEQAILYVVVPDFEQDANNKKFELAAMLAQMPWDYLPQEENFGALVGKEVW